MLVYTPWGELTGWLYSPAAAKPGLLGRGALAYHAGLYWPRTGLERSGIISAMELAANSRADWSGSNRPLLKAGFRLYLGRLLPWNLQGVFFSYAGTLMKRCCETNCNLWYFFWRGGKKPHIDLWRCTYLFFLWCVNFCWAIASSEELV